MAAAPTTTDFLDEDPELAGKRFALISFISPERVLKNRELFLFSEFRKQYVVDTRLKCFETFMAFVANKHSIRVDTLMADFKDFRSTHESTPEFSYSDAEEAWETWKLKWESKKNEEFNAANEFQTSIRGFKIRDVVASLEEANVRRHKFSKLDNNRFDIFVAEVGKWCPWHPTTAEIIAAGGNVEYSNERLNTLMQEYHKNEMQREEFFAKMRDDSKRKALAENEAKKAAIAAAEITHN